MRYYLIAGEASGDLNGSNLIKALKLKDKLANLRGWGGEKMEAEGTTLVKNYRDLAFMGFVEVISHLPEILKNLKDCKSDILQFNPDILILIDYPGFNLRIASWAKQKGIKVCYYISPQVWAWKEGRVKKIMKSVDKMLVILPFEEAFYQRHGFKVTYVGHPLTEIISEEISKPVKKLSDKPIIALLPGSRKQEIRIKLPIMLQVVKDFPGYQFIVAKAPSLDNSTYEIFLKNYPEVQSVTDDTYNLLKQSEAALVTSGTATLETGLFGVPEVVCYKGNIISYYLAKSFMKVKFISLVNLILEKPAVKELIQNEFNSQNLNRELSLLLNDQEKRDVLKEDYARLWTLLAVKNGTEKAASEIIEIAKQADTINNN